MGFGASKAEQFRAALDRFEGPLVRYAWRITGDLEQARDVVQDTFLRLCAEDLARIDGHLAQWLYTVCRNRAFDVRKKESRMHPPGVAAGEPKSNGSSGPRAAAERNEAQALVLGVVEALPEREKECFRLKFEHGLTYREISAVLDMPLATVSVTITRALNTIRERLAAQLDPAVDL